MIECKEVMKILDHSPEKGEVTLTRFTNNFLNKFYLIKQDSKCEV